jgi:ferric-dicitrate binding protein FerR (iron transport regulator)
MEQNHYNSEIDDLLIRYLIGSVSVLEKQEAIDWINSNKDHARYFDQLKDIYQLGKVIQKPSGFDKEKSLERIKLKFYQTKYFELKNPGNPQVHRKFSYKLALSIAAVFFLALSLGFFARFFMEAKTLLPVSQSLVFNEITAPLGSRTHVVLPDGTRVWLNAGSKIRYPMNFLDGDREVALTGEAYFEVKKAEKKRFIVKTSDLAIRVWGTKFNVRAYPEDATIQTTLVEGSVSILKLKGKNPEKETFLVPNQTAIFYINGRKPAEQKVNEKATVAKSDSMVKIEPLVKTILYTSWKDEKWIIEGQTLGYLAKEFERRYNLQISFDNEAIKNYKFNGILTDETFEQVLKVIKLSAPIDFTVTNNQVLLKENTNAKNHYDKYLKR